MHTPLKILFIEDHADLAANLADYFAERGDVVDVAMDGLTGLHLALVHSYDILVLDLMLPGMDGLTLCRKLRQEAGSQLPIIMLTARTSPAELEAGFLHGADDYLTKPFRLKELELRIRALTRRASGRLTRTLHVADLEFNRDTMRVQRGERTLELSAIPLKILETLMLRSPGIVERHDLETAIWGDSPPDSDALRVHMHTLRSAIDPTPKSTPPLLHTLRGIGYRLALPDASQT
ncbi:MAG: response regulator transcription factor [Magnetococcales bacterium]|nr:response regulator transcription factor [Magnetococcales bacterium]